MGATRTMLASERNLLWEWYKAKTALEAAKTLESKLRSELVAASKCGQIEEGRETINVDAMGDWKLTIDHKMSYSFDFSKLPESANSMLTELQHELNNILNTDCIVVKMEFSATNYKKLTPVMQMSLAPLVTTKPGTPQVNLVEPAKKDAL